MRPGHHPDVCISRESRNQARAELEARLKLGGLLGGGLGGIALSTFLPGLLGSLGIGKSKRSEETDEAIRKLFLGEGVKKITREFSTPTQFGTYPRRSYHDENDQD